MKMQKRLRPAHHSGMRAQLMAVRADTLLGKNPEACVVRMEAAYPKLLIPSSAEQHVSEEQLQAYLQDNQIVQKYVTNREFLKGDYGWKQHHQAARCYPLKDFNEAVLVARMAIPKEKCCLLFCDLVLGWGTDASDKGQLELGSKLIKGGFLNSYSAVNEVPGPQFLEEQSHVIFAAGTVPSRVMQTHNENFKEFIGAVNLGLSEQGFSFDWESCTDPGLEPIQLAETHFLFGFSKLTHFLYHKDRIFKNGKLQMSYLSVIVNITPSKSSFEVAGADEPFEFDGMGSAAVFPSMFWHRSSTAQTGTVKVALFYVKKERPAASSSVKKDQDKSESSDGAKTVSEEAAEEDSGTSTHYGSAEAESVKTESVSRKAGKATKKS